VAIEEVGGTSIATADDVAVAYCQGSPLRAAIKGHPTLCLTEATRVAGEALRQELGSGALTGRTGWIEVMARAGAGAG
jgi:hypothetical protein